MKIITRIIFSSIIGLLAFIYLHYGETGLVPELETDFLALIWTILISNLIGLGITRLGKVFRRILPWKRFFTTRFIAGLFSNALVGVGLITVGVFLYTTLFSDTIFQDFMYEYQDSAIKLGILLFFMLFIQVIVDFTFSSYNEYAVGQIESVKLEREHLELQFEALKTQLSPHYLFNCLNTISSLVDKNAEYAETFIRRLVQTYQYILDSKDKQLISLAEEIDFVKAYQFLLKVRFGDAMKINFELSEEVMKTRIPPLTIQILIENAVKHNEISEDDPLEVDIKMDNGHFISVRNDKTREVFEGVSSFKIGLENIQKRYQYFTNKPIKIIDQQNFEVKLPLIPAA